LQRTGNGNPENPLQKYEALLDNLDKIYPNVAQELERLSKPFTTPRGSLLEYRRRGGLVHPKSRSSKRGSTVKLM